MTLQRVHGGPRREVPQRGRDGPRPRAHRRCCCDLLGSPQRAYPAVHLTGTNGKTHHRAHGRRPAARVRPAHRSLHQPAPGLRHRADLLDGQPLDEERFVEVYDEIAPYVELVDVAGRAPMTFFEVLTGMAFAAFADAPVDVAVLEVGLGGSGTRPTSSRPRPASILPIGLDHVPLLGTTLAQIATEKAGIIHAAPPSCSRAAAGGRGGAAGPVRRGGRDGRPRGPGVRRRSTGVRPWGGSCSRCRAWRACYDDVFLPLHGPHQAQNAAAALAAVEAFLGGGEGARRRGGARRASPGVLTRPARGRAVPPTVIVDAAHNPARHGRDGRGPVRRVRLHPPRRRRRRAWPTRTPRDARGARARRVAPWSSPERLAARACPSRSCAELALDVFGEDRVHVEDGLDDALDTAVGTGRRRVRVRRGRRPGHRLGRHGRRGPHPAARALTGP